jgi:hypothetical protein
MTQDEIIEMAREAGLAHFYDSEDHCTGITDAKLITADKEKNDARLVEMLMPFANLVADKERERIIAANAPELEKVNAHIKRLEEQAYDLVGELRVANIKLSMRPPRTWVDSELIGVLKHCEDLLREDGHEDAVDDVQNMIAKIKAREA